MTRGCPTRSGSGSTNGSSTCLGSGELLRCCVLSLLAPLGPSSVSGSGELLLMCVLALLGPSSASLYSDSDLVVLGSEPGSRNVPCLDRAIVLLTLLTLGNKVEFFF